MCGLPAASAVASARSARSRSARGPPPGSFAAQLADGVLEALELALDRPALRRRQPAHDAVDAGLLVFASAAASAGTPNTVTGIGFSARSRSSGSRSTMFPWRCCGAHASP